MQPLLVLVALVAVEFGAKRKMIVAHMFSTETVLYVMQSLPRFQPENFAHNARLFDQVNEIAQRKGCTPTQLALAWVHHQGDDVWPIPSTTEIENFNQNIGALSVNLTPEEMAELESIASADNVKGGRCASSMPTWENSDTPPLSSWKAA
ncbi:hypothetical protein NL676_021584 [Syzygium grande]|nr:hypothetical protein NL676_021584 [Syzygium grande]